MSLWWTDLVRVMLAYRKHHGRWPNLVSPTRFNEKVQLAKVFWRTPLMVALADKVEAKRIVGDRLGDEWIIPTLYHGPWLPEREGRNWPFPYLVKANNGSGGHAFVRSAADADWDRIERTLRERLRGRHGRGRAEWVYGAIPPQVLVEPLLADGNLTDYKFHVFGGKVGLIGVHFDRFRGHRTAYFDPAWNLVQATNAGTPIPTDPIAPPASLSRMIAAAEQLAAGFPFVRVDFYEIDGQPKFGEVTFYPASGLQPFTPDSYDAVLGAMWPKGRPSA